MNNANFKHIRLGVIKLPWGVSAVKILEQTHTGMDFGASSQNFEGKITLSSIQQPEYSDSDQCFFMRGSSTDEDETVLLIPSDKIQDIVETVKMYNAVFSGYLACGDKLDSCVEIIE
jgi:hypothetical protein